MDAASRERIRKLREQLHTQPALRCAKCGMIIHETITGRYDTSYGVLCKICFGNYIGEEIEKHPIGPAPLERASK